MIVAALVESALNPDARLPEALRCDAATEGGSGETLDDT